MDYTHANETTPGKYISISRDKTIRLWECSGAFDQIYEFSSPNDQALCVAALKAAGKELFSWVRL